MGGGGESFEDATEEERGGWGGWGRFALEGCGGWALVGAWEAVGGGRERMRTAHAAAQRLLQGIRGAAAQYEPTFGSEESCEDAGLVE